MELSFFVDKRYRFRPAQVAGQPLGAVTLAIIMLENALPVAVLEILLVGLLIHAHLLALVLFQVHRRAVAANYAIVIAPVVVAIVALSAAYARQVVHALSAAAHVGRHTFPLHLVVLFVLLLEAHGGAALFGPTRRAFALALLRHPEAFAVADMRQLLLLFAQARRLAALDRHGAATFAVAGIARRPALAVALVHGMVGVEALGVAALEPGEGALALTGAVR